MLRLNFLYRRKFKRLFDILIAALLIILFLPVMTVIAFLVHRDGGPVLYGSARMGRHGRLFRAWKFRTMVANADEVLRALLAHDPARAAEWQANFRLGDDPRVTRVGRVLRATKLDELPQLLNVIRGDMSLVGPRPILIEEIEKYGPAIEQYKSIRPGLTGEWQVSHGESIEYHKRISLNDWYVNNHSAAVDLQIIFRTAGFILGRLLSGQTSATLLSGDEDSVRHAPAHNPELRTPIHSMGGESQSHATTS